MLDDVALAWIETALAHADAGQQALTTFRESFPGLSLTRCDQSDMGMEQPFRQYPVFNVYLVDARDHCWKFTNNPSEATGLVVARKRGVR